MRTKNSIFWLIFSLALVGVGSAHGNNLRIAGKVDVVGFTGASQDTAIVEFNMAWDNSWRDDFNWDAAWVFLKYRKKGAGNAWQHAYLGKEGHTATPVAGNEGGDYLFMLGETAAKVTGVYLVRDGVSEGNVNARMQLKWPIKANTNLTLSAADFGTQLDSIYLAVFAVEMVYLPYKPYYLGDGHSTNTLGDGAGGSVLVESEEALSKGGVTLSANYPKGYAGYYMMKYETSQEQYTEFLNSLTLDQQKQRVSNNSFETMSRGDYVFGHLKQPNNRNGIAFLMMRGGVALFGCNLNPANKFYSEDDGQTLACNYMSPADMLAYCDWAGLRPMSELEYEKAAHRPYPQLPDQGEFAWNRNTGVNPVTGVSALNNAGSQSETPADYRINVNAGNSLNGPVRSGAFATSVTDQVQAGATFWGLMEMSGNVAEMCYNVVAAQGANFKATNADYSHGDGVIIATGTNIAATYWPNGIRAIGLRGGSFASAEAQLRTSDRTHATGSYFSSFTQRDSTVGFRVVRNFTLPGAVLNAGTISAASSCPGTDGIVIESTTPGSAGNFPFTYQWYVQRGSNAWELLTGETGENLTYTPTDVFTTTSYTYKFRRKLVSAVGDVLAEVTVTIPKMGVTFTPTGTILGGCAANPVAVTKANASSTLSYSYNGSPIEGNVTTYTPLLTHFGADCGLLAVTVTETNGACSLDAELPVMVDCMAPGSCSAGVDYGGEHYAGVEIGAQCWMCRNLNVGIMVQGSDYNTHNNAGIQKFCYNNDPANCAVYGGLYSWYETVNGENIGAPNYKYVNGSTTMVQGICPDGWHVPSDAEWKTLEIYLGMKPAVANNTGWRGTNMGTKLKSNGTYNGYNFCPEGNCNSSGFSGLLGGWREDTGGVFLDLGTGSSWWPSSLQSGSSAWYRYLYYTNASVYRSANSANHGFGVRCLQS